MAWVSSSRTARSVWSSPEASRATMLTRPKIDAKIDAARRKKLKRKEELLAQVDALQRENAERERAQQSIPTPRRPARRAGPDAGSERPRREVARI